VITFIDMAVPAHRRGEDQIAVVHIAAPAVDDRGCSLCSRGEADRRERVAVWPRPIARIKNGEGGNEV
jgi:hypothetical protein